MQPKMTLLMGAILMAAVTGCATERGAGDPPAAHATSTTRFNPSLAQRIDAIGRRAVELDGIVGLSIAVARDGALVYSAGFGHADAERTIPATADTIYDIASVGKHFTSVAVLKLIERGQLTLDTKIKQLIPELPDSFPNATIEQLLRHTSGFVGGPLDELNPPAEYSTKRYGLELLTDIELVTGRTRFEPDETWVYCNPGYLVLGIAIEIVSGQRYDEFVRNELFDPNGLTDMMVLRRAEAPRMSDALRRTAEGVTPVPFIDFTAYAGQGSICSSVVDLLRWSRALNSGRLISHESLAMMRTSSIVKGDHAEASIPYGMAQRIGAISGHPKVGHTGTFDGGSAALAYYPDDELEVTVLSNTYSHGTPHAYTYETEIAKMILDVPPVDIASLAQPIPAELRAKCAGTYTAESDFTASFDGDELVVSRDSRILERLVYTGNGQFRDPTKPDVIEWFIMDGDRAGWWVYSASGNFLEVLRRID